MLEQEFNFYINNQAELVKEYNNKYIAIINKAVVGAYNSLEEAYWECLKKYKEGTFLLQYCDSGIESYTQTYNSRVTFA